MSYRNWILPILFLLPILAVLHMSCCTHLDYVWYVYRNKHIDLKPIGLIWSLIIFAWSLLLVIYFDVAVVGFQFVNSVELFKRLNINYIYGIDGISLWFMVLTRFLIPVCILCSWNSIKYRMEEFIMLLFIIELLLFQVFSVLDIILFYVFFERILIPMFLMIGIWGSRTRKVHAAYQFFLYTFCGSLVMLIAILYIYKNVGRRNYFVILNRKFLFEVELLLWLAFFISFAVKIPLMPVHIWLPEAHVEAPTAGSVLLAGILLKMGGYGLIRFNFPFFPEANTFFAPMVMTIGAISIIYASLTTLRQIDLKKIIAYTSVAHMGLATMGIFTNNLYGLEGSMILMLSHGLVSSALFLCVGVLYDRYGTRNIKYFGGLVNFMPIFSILFMIFSLANMGFPGTSAFIGEFVTLMGIFQFNTLTVVFAASSMILRAAYSLWLYNRIMFGTSSGCDKIEKRWLNIRLAHRFNPEPFEYIMIVEPDNPGHYNHYISKIFSRYLDDFFPIEWKVGNIFSFKKRKKYKFFYKIVRSMYPFYSEKYKLIFLKNKNISGYGYLRFFRDLVEREFLYLSALAVLVLIYGIFPNNLFCFFHFSVTNYLLFIKGI